MNRPLSLFSAALVALGACIPLGGCRGISSYSDYEDGARNGIVYYLPKTEYEVTFTIAREIKADPVDATKKIQEANIGIGCVPFFVVDRTVGPFTLHSSANEFFTRDHKVKVRDGLLTSVNVNDDGRLAVIAKNLGDAVAMVIAAQADPVGAAALISDAGKSGPGVAGGGADDEAIGLKLPELPAFPDLELVPPRILRNLRLIPTQNEISAMLLQLTPGEHKWHLSQGRESFQLQGASGRISASMATGKGGARDKGGLASSLPYMPARECGSTPGLVARNTTKDGVTITLDVEEGMIAEMRRAAAARNVTKLKQHKQKLEEIKQDYDREARILNAKLTEEGVRTNPLGKFPDASADMKTLK